jgi:hypothetical protein
MKKIKITMNEWQKELSKLPNYFHGAGPLKYTEEQDEQIICIRKNRKSFTDFSKWFRKKYGFSCEGSLRKRAAILASQGKI